eukprot:5807698-Amphidinium_carterae.1
MKVKMGCRSMDGGDVIHSGVREERTICPARRCPPNILSRLHGNVHGRRSNGERHMAPITNVPRSLAACTLCEHCLLQKGIKEGVAKSLKAW